MKVVFLSNFFTPHQLPLARALESTLGKDFMFFECVDVDKSTLPSGWREEGNNNYVVTYQMLQKNREFYLQRINDSDVVITGSAPEEYINERLKQGKLTFRYSERVYKRKCPWYEIPARAIKYYFKNNRYKNLYLLCASAYTAGDYARTGTFIGRAYKWGYFPAVKEYPSVDGLIKEKQANSFLWAGRMIDWKHPEAPIKIAKKLKHDGYCFRMDLIGTGEMAQHINELISSSDLSDCVQYLGGMSPGEVRSYMEKAEIYLFTSDRNEGWGAVLNEAMNSGCAVVASYAIGSVPYLIEDGENGFIYADGDIDDLYAKVKLLLDNPRKRKEIGREAYGTIVNQWNAQNAAERLLTLCQALLCGEKSPHMFTHGVCSKAESLKDNWYALRKLEQ